MSNEVFRSLRLSKEIVHKNPNFSVAFSEEIRGYVLVVPASFEDTRQRYFKISSSDYKHCQRDAEGFYMRHYLAIHSSYSDPYLAAFIGSNDIRNYECVSDLFDIVPEFRENFAGFVYRNHVLWLAFDMPNGMIYIPPVYYDIDGERSLLSLKDVEPLTMFVKGEMKVLGFCAKAHK